jgi:hypothetical protein
VRWLLTALVLALLALGFMVPAPSPGYAASPTVGAGHEAQAIPMVGSARIEKEKDKKKSSKGKKSSKSKNKNSVSPTVEYSLGAGPVPVSIDPLKDPIRGEQNVFVQAVTPAGSGVTACNVTVRYRLLGDVNVGNPVPDSRGVCILRFNVPNDGNAVGGAGIIMTFYNAANQPVGQGTRGFIVKP